MNASIVIAWRDSGDPHRQANLVRVLGHLADLEWPLILADDGGEPGTPFNRQRAYNRGMALSPSDVYVFHEADVLVSLENLFDATVIAERRLGMVVPFTRYRYFNEITTQLILSGVKPETLHPDRIMDHGTSIGAVNVASAASMRAIGQWDERLTSHGYDDRAMYHAFRTACGAGTYVEGDANHLWHPPAYSPWERVTAAADAANYQESEVQATVHNRARMRKYIAAETPERVRELTGGAE